MPKNRKGRSREAHAASHSRSPSPSGREKRGKLADHTSSTDPHAQQLGVVADMDVLEQDAGDFADDERDDQDEDEEREDDDEAHFGNVDFTDGALEDHEQEEEESPPIDMDGFEWVEYGAGQSKTWHLVPKGWAERGKKSDPKIDKMYDSTDQVSEQRSYAGDREVQALRWLSTVVFANADFAKGEEIQAYYDKATDQVILSSNKNAVNNKLKEYLKTPDAIKKLRDAMGGTERERRHYDKLVGREEARAEQQAIVDAILKGQFVVPDNLPKDQGDLHAERRIERHLGGRPLDDTDQGYLGGVKRPCAACTFALNLVGKARSGPLWPSRSALGGLTIDQIHQLFLDQGQLTYVTAPRTGGRPTTGYNTDSDSDKSAKEDGGDEDDDGL